MLYQSDKIISLIIKFFYFKVIFMLPWKIYILSISPSKSCGPFRLYSSDDFVYFDTVTNMVSSWDATPQRIVSFFGTVAFFIPAFLILM